ncbi:hypothetical protein JDW15_06125 [Aerococcaceae bacterium zg-ZJ1578]|uniref:hypothetical protein n=1 Tax=Aerococcaceae bacterium zg-252 TaxID=2796928 RepID=UPI001A1B9952|nr:hypothetical protein [Aerococcaceae bacterium zg-1578]
MNKEDIKQELAELKNKIAQLEKALDDSEDVELSDGDSYYVIESDGRVVENRWDNDFVDKNRLSIGNVFKTKEEAEFEVEARKVYHELKKFSRPFVKNKGNWVIGYDLIRNDFSLIDMLRIKSPELYFESKETAKKAFDAVGADRVKKYYLRVEE